MVVVNQRASGERRSAELLRAARAAAPGLEVVATATEAELASVLAQAAGRRVVLVGGDGSLQAAVNAAPAPGELALLPAGRANNVARALGIPADPARAVAVALGAPARPLDLLRVEGPAGRTLRCVEGVSVGLQAEARAGYDGANSADLRAGAMALARAVARHRPGRVRIELDGGPPDDLEVDQVFVSNLPYFAFGFHVDPLADPYDGRLEVVAVRAASRRALPGLLLAAYRGRHLHRPGVSVRRGRRAVVRGDLALAGDGGPLGRGDVSVSIEPAAVRIAAPGA